VSWTVELIWCLGRAGDLRSRGVAAISADLGPHRSELQELFRSLGELALESAEDADEVWSWHPAEHCLETAGIGLALLRGNEFVGHWSFRDLNRRAKHCT